MRRCKICKVDIDDQRLIPLCVSCKVAGAYGAGLAFVVALIVKGFMLLVGYQ